MSLLTCCFWWFVLGLLLGWLLNWLLTGLLRKEPPVDSRIGISAAKLKAMATAAPARGVDMSAARAAGFNLKHPDDLTVIEGIGPKVDELFRVNGITTFLQVSRLGVGEMQAILDKGGTHFRLANPHTWAQQASLALENRWSDLKKLQHELFGGAEPAENH